MLFLHVFVSDQSARTTVFTTGITLTRFGFAPVPELFEDSLPVPAEAYLQLCSAVSEASLDVTVSPSAGTTVQRTSVLHTEEIVRDSPGSVLNICTPISYDSH